MLEVAHNPIMLGPLPCLAPAVRSLAFAVLLLCLPTLACAWGQTGHRLVGELAAAELTPAARAKVDRLLADEPEPTLAGVSVWADDVRETPEYQWTTSMHWVNFAQGQCNYNAATQCPDGRCVVEAIGRFQTDLADPDTATEQRRTALKFLVHFVGDIHQPMHAGYAADRGGNQFQINYLREGWNLHSVWDSLILDSLKLDLAAYRDRLMAIALSAEARDALQRSDPADWAEESCRLVQQDAFYPPKHKITGRYLDAKRPLAEQQLKLAGSRLAALLNAALAD